MLEFEQNLYWCWIVWAFKPGDIQVVALCTNQETAMNYTTSAIDLYPDHRLYAEKAPMDHLFGASDLRSVAGRAILAKHRRRR